MSKKNGAKKAPDEYIRCKRCGLAVTRTPYGRWKHVGNRSSGAGCGMPPDVDEGAPKVSS